MQHSIEFLLSSGGGFDLLSKNYGFESVLLGGQLALEAVVQEYFARSLTLLRSNTARVGTSDKCARIPGRTPAALADYNKILRRLITRPVLLQRDAHGAELQPTITSTPPSIPRKPWFVSPTMISELHPELEWTFVPVGPGDSHGRRRSLAVRVSR